MNELKRWPWMWAVRLLLQGLAGMAGAGATAAEVQAVASLVPSVEGNTVFLIDGQSRLYSIGSDVHGQLGAGTLLESQSLLPVGRGFRSVSVGSGHMAALEADGSLWTWGWGTYGQLGNGGTTSVSTPERVGSDFTQVLAGNVSTYGLKGDGTLWAWGQGIFGTGQSINVSYTPVQVGTGFRAVASGGNHALAVSTRGELYAWGDNSFGQVGVVTSDTCNPGTNSTYTCSFSKVLLRGGMQAVAAGASSSYALADDGVLWAWGGNDQGQLGDGTTRSRTSLARLTDNVVQVSAGGSMAAALKRDGTAWVWGAGLLVPLQVGAATTVAQVHTDGTRLFVLRRDGTLWSHLPNQPGETRLADGVVQFAVAQGNLAVVKADGTLWASGGNNYGQLGQGTTISRAHPAQVPGAFRSVAIDWASGLVLAVKTDGSLWTWGNDQSTPRPIPGEGSFTAVAVHGGGVGIALRADGALYAVTSGVVSRIGNDFAQIAGGGSFFAAIKKDGTLWTWSPAAYATPGASGIANTNQMQLAGSGFSKVSAGDSYVMALKPDGSLWGWGDNSAGQLGVASGDTCTEGAWNTPENLSAKPCARRPLRVGSGYVDVAAGYSHTLAIQADGSLWAWGLNLWGAFGDGRREFGALSPTPPQRIGSGYSKAVAFAQSSLAIRPDGSVWSWGRNLFGSLGHGTLGDAPVPTPVVDDTATGYLNLSGQAADLREDERLAYFLLARSQGGRLDISLTDLRAAGFEGSVYFTAWVPSNSPLAPKAGASGSPPQRRHATASGQAPSIPVSLGRNGYKQTGPSGAADPAAEGAGVISTGNQFTAYQGLAADPLYNSNVVVCAGVTTPALSAKGQVLVRAIANGTAVSGVAQCPPVQTPATLRLYRGQAVGSLDRKTIVATITPQPEDRGQERYLYSWAVTPDGLQYMQVGDNAWEVMKEPMQAVKRIVVPLTGDITLPIVRDMNLSALPGTHVFVGLGTSWADVRNFNKAGHYYTVD